MTFQQLKRKFQQKNKFVHAIFKQYKDFDLKAEKNRWRKGKGKGEVYWFSNYNELVITGEKCRERSSNLFHMLFGHSTFEISLKILWLNHN